MDPNAALAGMLSPDSERARECRAALREWLARAALREWLARGGFRPRCKVWSERSMVPQWGDVVSVGRTRIGILLDVDRAGGRVSRILISRIVGGAL